MAELEAASKVAKDLGIYLGQIYGYVKSGKVKNHKEGGYPVGKGLIVDPDEVKAAWQGSKKKGPRGPRKSKAHAITGEAAADTVKGGRRLKTGTIVSFEEGKPMGSDKIGPPRYTVAQVIGSTAHLTYMDSGNHRRHYTGVTIENFFYGTDRFSTMLSKNVARVERPLHVLGMVILAFIVEGKTDLAASLETWMEKNDLEVHIPEVLDLEDEDSEPGEIAVAVSLAGDDDD